MLIEWFGDSSFLLRTAGVTVAVDPVLGAAGQWSAGTSVDIVIHSLSMATGPRDLGSATAPPGMSENAFVVAGPGDYEIGGVFIMGMNIGDGSGASGGEGRPIGDGSGASGGEGRPIGDGSGASGGEGRPIGYVIDADELTICHLGSLTAMPAQEHVEALGPVDVLLLPVGGGPTLDPDGAVELVGQMEPSVIVPTHFGSPDRDDLAPVDRFLSEMGVEAPEPLDVLDIACNRLPLEPKVVLLRPRS